MNNGIYYVQSGIMKDSPFRDGKLYGHNVFQFSGNSEATASELPENLKKYF